MNPGVNIRLHHARGAPLFAPPLAKPAPPPEPRPELAGPEQIVYVGRRNPDGTKRVFVVTNGLQRRLPSGPILPAGLHLYAAVLEWGYRGPGPRHLAVALLAHAAGPEAARLLHEVLAEKLTFLLHHQRGWRLTREQVLSAVGIGGAGRAA